MNTSPDVRIQRHQLLFFFFFFFFFFWVEALVGGHPARILPDTGASHSFVSQWRTITNTPVIASEKLSVGIACSDTAIETKKLLPFVINIEEANLCSLTNLRTSTLLERFRDSHSTDRITYQQSVKLIRNLEFRASSAQLYVYVWRNEKWLHDDFELASPTSGELRNFSFEYFRDI